MLRWKAKMYLSVRHVFDDKTDCNKISAGGSGYSCSCPLKVPIFSLPSNLIIYFPSYSDLMKYHAFALHRLYALNK